MDVRNLLLNLLFLTLIYLVLIEGIERSDFDEITIILASIATLYNFRANEPTFQWELLVLLTAIPYLKNLIVGLQVSGPPIYLHIFPAIAIAIVLLFA